MIYAFSPSRHQVPRGFTIVELLIVVIVIAILAAIVAVAYSGVQRQAVRAIMQNTARDVAKAAEMKKVVDGVYPSAIPDTLTIPSGVGVGITEVDSADKFCFNVTTTRYADIVYSINQMQELKDSLCPGAVIATEGEYGNEAPVPVEDSWVNAPTAGRAVAPGDMEFTATTNDTWSQLTLSWKAMPGATLYRINQRTSSSSLWYVRSLTSSAGYSADSTKDSGAIAASVTSQVWNYNIPSTLSDTYGYRIQYKKADGTFSDWQELTLSPMANRTMPTIRNFKVTPNANWSNITLSWDSLGNFAKLPNIQFRINQRDSPQTLWYVRNPADGGGFSWDATKYSGVLNATATSQVWAASIPTDVSKVYEYRIQFYSGTATSEWATFTLNPLKDRSLPRLSNFKVTPNANWSNITLSWDSIGDYANLPAVKFRINQRVSPSGVWYVRNVASGAGYNWDNTGYSGAVSPSLTSQTWTYTIPAAGSTYDYRIQVYSGPVAGEWAEFSLSR